MQPTANSPHSGHGTVIASIATHKIVSRENAAEI